MRIEIQITLTVLLTLLSSVLFISCGNSDDRLSQKEYKNKINQWHEDRISSLKEKDSWLSLAGLYKLKKGVNTLGSDSSNSMVFPAEAALKIGTITFTDSTFSFEANPEVAVTQNGQKVTEKELQTDAEGNPTILKYDSFFWYIIERRDNHYVRLKDTNHPNFASFNGIDRFPVSRDWHVKAIFNRFDNPKTISIPDVLGEVYQDSLYGLLEFNVDGQQYSLAPLGNPDTDEEFFIILGDQTNGESTYSGGRYLYVPTPDENGTTYIDFNKAYNPPCVFTRFATCPLPPAQNRLDVKVTAGEKMYHHTTGN